jgi:hypothetical protein
MVNITTRVAATQPEVASAECPVALVLLLQQIVMYCPPLHAQVMDEIVPEPLGGAHADPVSAFPMIKESILKTYSK